MKRSGRTSAVARSTVIACGLLALAPGTRAADDADADALSLADKAAPVAQRAQDWRLYLEGVPSRQWESGAASADSVRLSADGVYDGQVARGWRAVVSDRLDVVRANDREQKVNALREAYVSWTADPAAIVDLGRVNLHYGTALGYNPTDFFKAGALRSIVSPDPQSQRENRQGTMLLQGQALWNEGSASALFSPRLGARADAGAYALDFGATNPRNRWLLATSRRFTETFSPQVLVSGGADQSVQLGLNLSSLVTAQTTAFAELSAGKGASLASQALSLAEPATPWQRRASIGLTATTDFNLSLTLEAEFDSAAPDQAQWRALSSASPSNARRVLGTSQAMQELPARRALFSYFTLQDLVVQHLDLSGFVRDDVTTHSRAQWIELRYHWDRIDAALQWSGYAGGSGSAYAAVPQRREAQVLVRVFL